MHPPRFALGSLLLLEMGEEYVNYYATGAGLWPAADCYGKEGVFWFIWSLRLEVCSFPYRTFTPMALSIAR